MLFRRVKQHVEKENWFAVFVDFIIVVVGVYVGLEVSNINEKRQEQDRGVSYLERIRADLETDLVSGQASIVFWQQVIDYGEAAIAHGETGELSNDSVADTVLAYYQASQVGAYQAIDTTYLELKGAAEFRLIPSAEVLSDLANYYVLANGRQASHLLEFVPAYRENIRGHVPWEIQEFIWAECHETDLVSQYLVDCSIPMSDDEGLALLKEFAAEKSILQELRFWIANLSVAKNVLSNNLIEAKHSISKIDATIAEIS